MSGGPRTDTLRKAARAYRLEVARWQRDNNEGRYLDYAVAQRGDDLDAAIEASSAPQAPEGHTLIDGYCPTCNGGCLVGFGNDIDEERCPVEGCDELPEDHYHPAPQPLDVERLVSALDWALHDTPHWSYRFERLQLAQLLGRKVLARLSGHTEDAR